MRLAFNIQVSIFCGLILSSCGARTKSASDVSGIFKNQDALSLGTSFSTLCDNVRSRTEAPNMSKASLSETECADAGKNADNYKAVKKAFNFEGLTNEVNKVSGKDVLHIRTRAKVWLNSSILDLALKLTKALKARENGGEDIFAKPPQGGAGDGLDNLLKIAIKELQKVEFNQADRSFAGKVNISASGLAKLNNDIEVAGRLLANSVAVNVNSTASADFKDSLVKDVNVTGIITPYAGDVYVDIVFEVNIHSIGLNNFLFDKINSALGSSMKTILDTLLKLEK
jgi:hypothetical protein